MDTETGRIYTPEEMEELKKVGKHIADRCIPMELDPTPEQLKRKPPKVGRNEPCPCNSGKKFRKCCQSKTNPALREIEALKEEIKKLELEE